jgi:hypothetical protein
VGIVRENHAVVVTVEVGDEAIVVDVDVPELVVAVVDKEVAPVVDVDGWVVDVESEETARGAST